MVFAIKIKHTASSFEASFIGLTLALEAEAEEVTGVDLVISEHGQSVGLHVATIGRPEESAPNDFPVNLDHFIVDLRLLGSVHQNLVRCLGRVIKSYAVHIMTMKVIGDVMNSKEHVGFWDGGMCLSIG